MEADKRAIARSAKSQREGEKPATLGRRGRVAAARGRKRRQRGVNGRSRQRRSGARGTPKVHRQDEMRPNEYAGKNAP